MLSFISIVHAQEVKRFNHEASLLCGGLYFNNSYMAPSGLLGNSIGAEYSLTKHYSNKPKELLLTTSFTTARLNFNKNTVNPPQYNFYKGSLAFGYNKLFAFKTQKTVLKLGGLVAIDVDGVISTEQADIDLQGYPNDFGRWQIGVKPFVGLSHVLGDFKASINLSTPIVGWGITSEYPNARSVLTYSTINSYIRVKECYWIGEVWDINSNFKVVYNKSKIKPFVMYSLSYFELDLSYVSQKYMNHSIGVGINF